MVLTMIPLMFPPAQYFKKSNMNHTWAMYGHVWFIMVMYGHTRLALYSFLCILKIVSIVFFVSATSSTCFSVFGSHSNSS